MSDDETTYAAIRTILGSTARRERWHLTDEVDVLTALGRSTFDLRDVETTGRDVVEISAICLLGSIRLIVPRGTMVVLDGTSFLASASSVVEPGNDGHLPRIELTATTILGKVKVVSAEPAAAPAEPAPVAEPVAAASAAPAPDPTPAPEEPAAVAAVEDESTPAPEAEVASAETDADDAAEDDAAPLAS